MKNIPLVLSTLGNTELKNKLVRVLELVNCLEEYYEVIFNLHYVGEGQESEEEILEIQKNIDDDMDELYKLLIN